jgi:hypothetical protein
MNMIERNLMLKVSHRLRYKFEEDYLLIDYECGTTSSGVRKACKNCTCGLAQELEQEEHAEAQQNIKSSCGSVCIEKYSVFTLF